MITFSDDVLKFIIEEYTLEAGVRKLKEILYEIVGEINLDFLHKNNDIQIPLVITIDDIKTRYLKEKREQLIRKVFDTSKIGFVNGMYATSQGVGGTLPIHAKYYPSDKFLENAQKVGMVILLALMVFAIGNDILKLFTGN
jgi:ATP-dependent Lon protease